jgi:hypothetical protein
MTDQITKPINGKYVKNLKIGDLIFICGNGYGHPAIFAGIGKSNNLQYYYLSDWILKTKTLRKSYISTNIETDGRVVRIHPRDINKDLRDKYYKLIELMQEQELKVEANIEYIND